MNTYWFFDTALKRATENAKNIPGPLKKDPLNPLCMEGADAEKAVPWEVGIENGYPNVFFDPLVNKYRCYYTSYVENADGSIRQAYREEKKNLTGILYAESEDGVRWIKPALGAVKYRGNTDNNIIALCTHGAGVFLDQADPDPQKRYKMISRNDRGPLNIFVAFSPDGVHFGEWITAIDSPSYPGDTHNFVLRDPENGRYLLYTRTFARETRVEARFVSDDFIHWREATQVLSGTGLDDQIYGMPVFCQDGLYWGLADMYDGGDASLPHFDHVDVELCYSGNGLHWQRITPGVPFLPNGPQGSHDGGCCYASAPIIDGEEALFYYMGGNGTHYGTRTTGLCRARIHKKRLAGVAALGEGAFTYQTRALSASGPVHLCADVLPGGFIRYEALNQEGQTIPGCTKDACTPLSSSCDDAPLRWPGASLPQEPFMLRFFCENAVLYSLHGDMALQTPHPL